MPERDNYAFHCRTRKRSYEQAVETHACTQRGTRIAFSNLVTIASVLRSSLHEVLGVTQHSRFYAKRVGLVACPGVCQFCEDPPVIKYPAVYVALYALLFSSLVAAEEPALRPDEVSGSVRAVTLYRDRALVTREIQIVAGEKARVISVPDLPELVVADSVSARGDKGIVVRAVRVSPHVVGESRREDVLRFDQLLEELNRSRAETQHNLDVATQNLELLGQLISFSVSSTKSDLDRGVLDANTLTGLATFSMTQRRELASEQFQRQSQLNEIDKEIQTVSQQRQLATQGRQTNAYQAKIFIEAENGLAGTVRLNYQVTGCGWSPQYVIRGLLAKKSVELQYNALIRQMSGEDWNGVHLVLSTALPSINAERPLLTPLQVTSKDPAKDDSQRSGRADENDPFGEASAPHVAKQQVESLTSMIQALRTQQRQTESMFGAGHHPMASHQRDLTLNSLAGQLQQIELQAAARSLRSLAPDVDENVTSQVYELPQPVSLAARREQQLVQICDAPLASTMYHVATPLLSTFAYREAEMNNTLPISLLGGPATIYLDDRFVGHSEIPSTASGQRLVVGFGADQQVRTRRELLDKRDLVQGGNRQLELDYRLVLSNFKGEAVAVRLIDRMPNTLQTDELSLQLVSSGPPLSDDGLYLRVLRPTGILRWDLTVPEGRHGSKALDVDYSFFMEFDRQHVPTTNHTLDELQAEYQNVNFGSSGGGGFGGAGFGGGFGGGGSN